MNRANSKLFEAYSKRLAIADNVYSKTHEGAKLDESKKLMVAVSLNNINKLLTEGFNNSVGTQRADIDLIRCIL